VGCQRSVAATGVFINSFPPPHTHTPSRLPLLAQLQGDSSYWSGPSLYEFFDSSKPKRKVGGVDSSNTSTLLDLANELGLKFGASSLNWLRDHGRGWLDGGDITSKLIQDTSKYLGRDWTWQNNPDMRDYKNRSAYNYEVILFVSPGWRVAAARTRPLLRPWLCNNRSSVGKIRLVLTIHLTLFV
jgi:hypothetical protein